MAVGVAVGVARLEVGPACAPRLVGQQWRTHTLAGRAPQGEPRRGVPPDRVHRVGVGVGLRLLHGAGRHAAAGGRPLGTVHRAVVLHLGAISSELGKAGPIGAEDGADGEDGGD